MDLNWDNTKEWKETANRSKTAFEPQWEWDCGFKLDFDGQILRIESRFYPPHKNLGNFWEGSLRVMFLDKLILEKEFKSNALDELKEDVESFSKHYMGIVKARMAI